MIASHPTTVLMGPHHKQVRRAHGPPGMERVMHSAPHTTLLKYNIVRNNLLGLQPKLKHLSGAVLSVT